MRLPVSTDETFLQEKCQSINEYLGMLKMSSYKKVEQCTNVTAKILFCKTKYCFVTISEKVQPQK